VAIAAIVLWLMTGSLLGMMLPLLSCLTSTLWVFGAMATLGIDINLITLVLASMMICVGSVYGVHVFARYEVIAEGGGDAREIALASLLYARTPVLMAGFTTCIGFGALLLTEIPATNELGAFSILGVASVTVLSLTGIPAALVLFPARASVAATRVAQPDWFSRRLSVLLSALASLAVERPGRVIAVWGLVALGAIAVIPRIAIDTDVITFFREDSPVRTDFAAVNRLLSGAVPIYVSVSGEGEGTFREPANLRALAALQSDLEAVPGVSQVLSSVDLVRRVNLANRADDPAYDRVPDTRAGVAEATFMLPKTKLRRFSTSNHSRANLIVRTGESGSSAVRALEERLRAAIERAGLPPSFRAEVTGNAILLNRSADGIAGNQATQVGFAAATILVLICVVFRSLRTGLISMVPNIVPVLLFFGVLGLGAASLSLPTSLIGSIALGIAIDDTMHFLVAYRARRDAGAAPEVAARECVLQVGRPIVMTSIMLVVGFLVILASGFATLQEFGALTALTMGLCLATDLILLPALLVRLRA
jgi:predicted RND superfamily exporter protein